MPDNRQCVRAAISKVYMKIGLKATSLTPLNNANEIFSTNRVARKAEPHH